MHHLSFAFSLLAIIGLHESVQSTGRRSERSIERTFISLLMVPNGMTRGSWGEREFCPSGTYAKGFSLKVEEPAFWDKTALNGIRLHCVSRTSEIFSVQSDIGSWGKWTKTKWCPSGFLTAFQLRVQSFQDSRDETAANNIRFNCSQGFYLQGDGTDLGEWGNWSPQCQGRGMCGIKTRIEEPQGLTKDDTALNDVRMFCCE